MGSLLVDSILSILANHNVTIQLLLADGVVRACVCGQFPMRNQAEATIKRIQNAVK